MTRVIGPPRSRRRRWTFLWCLTVAVAAGIIFIPGALAVHDLAFQLDGDVSTTAYSPPAGSSPLYDWGQNASNTDTDQTDPGHGLFHVTVSGDTQTVCPTPTVVKVDPTIQPGCTASATGVFDAASFQRDFLSGATTASCSLTSSSTTKFCTGDDTTYATGSKDTLGIGDGGWQCNHDSNVNSKIDIMNAYVATYHNAAGDLIEYFGLEKNKNNGTNDVGIWFLQGDAQCSAPSGHQNFSGHHRNGDVLVVSEFTAGGGVSTVKAFRWRASTDPTSPFFGDGGCIDSHNNSDSNFQPKLGGCDLKSFGSGQDCKQQGGGAADLLCATTNATGLGLWNTNVRTPWLTADATLGVGHTAVPPDFFEGGINITQVFKAAGGGTAPSCFTVGIPDTRSSASVTATLFDYVINKIGSCETTLSTQENSGGPLSIGTGVVSSGTDTATLTVSGTPTWGGTLTWYLCGPIASPTLCDNHGVQVTSRTVSNSSPATDFVSDAAFLTSAGRYCWHAHFEPDGPSADAGVTAADDDGTNECFTVNPVTPTLTTSATCSNTPCVLGVDTLSDTATLGGTATQPGTAGPGGDTSLYKSIYLTDPTGTLTGADNNISWVLYKVSCSGSTTTPTGSPIAANGDGTYGPVTYTPTLADGVGDYTFVANYGGQSPNTNAAATATCASPNPGTGQTETITLTGEASSASDQRWLPNDRVTLTTSGGTLTGTLTVSLYSGTFTVTTGVCTPDSPGSTAITGQSYTFNPSDAASGSTFNTTNSTFFVGTGPDGTNTYGSPGAYFWLVQYHDNNLTSPKDHCESSNVTITN